MKDIPGVAARHAGDLDHLHERGTLPPAPQETCREYQTVIPRTPPQHHARRPTIDARCFRRKRARTDAVAVLGLQQLSIVAPRSMDDDGAGLVPTDRPCPEHTPEQLLILAAVETCPRAELLVEPTDAIEHLTSERHVGPVPDRRRVVGGTERGGVRAIEHDRRGVVRDVGDHPSDAEAGGRLHEGARDRLGPPRLWKAVVVGERHKRRAGRPGAGVARTRGARLLAPDHPDARPFGDVSRVRALRCRVDDDEFVPGANRSLHRGDGVGEERRAIAGAHDDGHPWQR